MKRNYVRLQGAEWHNKKDNLILFSYKKNNYGRIKGFYKEKDRDGYWYTHWMNDKEIEEFNKTHKPKVRTRNIQIKKDFIIDEIQFVDGDCGLIFIPAEIEKEKSYTEKDLLCYIHELRSNWEDLKKWLVEKVDACGVKRTSEELERQATYENVLNKMIGLEGRDNNADV